MTDKNYKGLWWYADEDSLSQALVSVWKNIESSQQDKVRRWKRWLGLYEGREIRSFNAADFADYLSSELIKINVTESVIDSLVSKIATNTPRAWVLTDNGDWDLREKAQAMTDLIAGVYQDQGVYQIARDCFLSACIFADGYTQVFPDVQQGTIQVENVFRPELRFDDLDGRYRRPRSSYRHKIMSRPVVEEMYGVKIPKLARDADMICPGLDKTSADIMRQIEDPVSVIEAYHLPSGPEAKDGRRAIVTPSGTVIDERWRWPFFPYARLTIKPRAIGMDGKGAAEQLEGHQSEINAVAQKLQVLMQKATVRWMIERGSHVSEAEATNEPMAPTHYTGTPPTILPDVPFHPAWLEYLRMLKAECYELFGLSMLYAQGKKPAGIDSGEGLRELKDSESERFLDIGQAYDEYHVTQNGVFPSVSRLIIWSAAVIDEEREGGFSATLVSDGDSLRQVSWKECQMGASNYRLGMWPSALLPKQPAGRLQTVKELVGMFPQLQPMLGSLLKFPDLGPAMSVIADPTEGILQDLKKLNHGERANVEPFINKALARDLVQGSYLSARGKKAPREVLQAHLNYLIALKAEMDREKAEAAMAAAPAMPVGGLGGSVSPPPIPGPPAGGMLPPGPPLLPTDGSMMMPPGLGGGM